MTLTALLAGGADAREASLGSMEWPTQFNDARPTGDDLHPYETRGAATFLPLIVEHRPHTRSGRANKNSRYETRGYSPSATTHPLLFSTKRCTGGLKSPEVIFLVAPPKVCCRPCRLVLRLFVDPETLC